jgi:hypothetical protein
MLDVKHCTKCDKVKPMREFSIYRGNHDGRQPHCKACAKAYAEAYRRSKGIGPRAKVL